MTQLVQALNNYSLNPFSHILAALKAYKTYLDQQSIYRELSALTDYELRDMGINRHDIYAISRGKSFDRGDA